MKRTILLAAAAVAASLHAGAALPATFTVDTLADHPDAAPGDGVCLTTAAECSLRAAIEEANTTPDLDTIAFAIPGAGPHVLAFGSELPVVSEAVVIDGFTQPGAQPNTSTTGLNAEFRIVLDLSPALKLVFEGGNTTVRGLVAGRGMVGVEFRGRPGNVVEGCYIGTNRTGDQAAPNLHAGVFVNRSTGNRIGGLAPAQRNLISGNVLAGIQFDCGAPPCSADTAILGNLIGTNAAATQALPNLHGIVGSGMSGLVIGGITGSAANVIAGNTYGGITLDNGGQAVIQGNRIGTGFTGLERLGNASGLQLGYLTTTVVGGTPGAGNRIAYNGVGISSSNGYTTISHNEITSNGFFGIDVQATDPSAPGSIAENTIAYNGLAGIKVQGSAWSPTVLTIADNVLMWNGADDDAGAVTVLGPYDAVRLTGNSIHDNFGPGLDLLADGPTPNDPFDSDVGPNGLQNFPVLTSACAAGPLVTVRGRLDSAPTAAYTLEFFKNAACDPSASGEGGAYLGAASLATGSDGGVSFAVVSAASVSPTDVITATATGVDGTSEFGNCTAITVQTPPPVQAVSGPAAVCAGSPFLLRAVGGADAYQWFLDGHALPGATGASYGRPAASPGDAGTYSVTASSCGLQETSPPFGFAVPTCTAFPLGLDVDRHAAPGTTSDLDGILEPGETATIEPRYLNAAGAAVALRGTATIAGPPGGDHALPDGDADYGTVGPAQVTDCFGSTGDCYRATVSAPARPVPHWDALLFEATSGGDPTKRWPLHVGDTFADVPRANAFYRFVETLVHREVTGGCTSTNYCPASATTREQMALFTLAAKEGQTYVPPACNAASPRFTDVPAANAFCPWIEELARRGVVAGCTATSYCPVAPIAREGMAVFVLATREAPGYAPPACVAGSEMFADVPASSVFCRWIEELARRNVVAGCGGGNYCPQPAVTRGEMSVFIVQTFGLLIYGP